LTKRPVHDLASNAKKPDEQIYSKGSVSGHVFFLADWCLCYFCAASSELADRAMVKKMRYIERFFYFKYYRFILFWRIPIVRSVCVVYLIG
jgi:hypothetical protein